MRKIFPLLLLALFLAPCGLQAKYQFDETVYFPLPAEEKGKWKLERQKGDENKGIAVTRYILESENEKNWTHLIDIHFTSKKLLKNESAEEMMQEEISKSKTVNQKVHWKNPHDLLYERQFPTGEHEIVRMIMTKKGLHRIAYIRRGPITKEERTEWIHILSKGMIGGPEDPLKEPAKKKETKKSITPKNDQKATETKKVSKKAKTNNSSSKK